MIENVDGVDNRKLSRERTSERSTGNMQGGRRHETKDEVLPRIVPSSSLFPTNIRTKTAAWEEVLSLLRILIYL